MAGGFAGGARRGRPRFASWDLRIGTVDVPGGTMPAQDTLTVLTETVPLYGRVLSAVEGFEQELRRHLRNRLAELGEVLATADIDYDVEQTKITTLDSGTRFLAYSPITRVRTYAAKDESS